MDSLSRKRQPRKSQLRYDNRSYSEKVAGTKKGLLFAVKVSKPLRFVLITKSQLAVSAFVLLLSIAFISWGFVLIKKSEKYKSEDMVETFKEDEGLWTLKYKPQLEAVHISVVTDS